MRKSILGVFLLVGLGLAGLTLPVSAGPSAVVGQAAPDFKLADTTGAMRALSEYKGKMVVLEWFNPDCPFVKKHYDSGNMQKLQKTYSDKGVIWLSIDSSAMGKEGSLTPEQADAYMKNSGANPTAVFLDIDGKVGKLYGAQTTPHMFIIDPKGTLIYAGAIDDTPSVDVADVQTAKNYVSAALDEAMDGKPVTTSSTKSYGCSVKY